MNTVNQRIVLAEKRSIQLSDEGEGELQIKGEMMKEQDGLEGCL